MIRFKSTAAAVNEKFQRLFVFAYNCILAHIVYAVITVNTLAMGAQFRRLKDLPRSSQLFRFICIDIYIQVYISIYKTS